MKSLTIAICFMVLSLAGANSFAANNDELLPVLKEIVAKDKARFGVDGKKCLLECQRVYSPEHCIVKCAEIAREQREAGFNRESEERARIEAEKPVKYREAAEKYR